MTPLHECRYFKPSDDGNQYVCVDCGAMLIEQYEDADDYYRGDVCPECGGSGLDRYESFRECDNCFGEGYLW
jgi:DNA-directed RNA polymerase subunit RPC12/RpoP